MSAERNGPADNLLAAERMVKRLAELVQLSEDWEGVGDCPTCNGDGGW